MYSFLVKSDIWMCTLVVRDDDYVYSYTARTVTFRGTTKNNKQTSKKLAVGAFLFDLQKDEYEASESVDNYWDSDSESREPEEYNMAKNRKRYFNTKQLDSGCCGCESPYFSHAQSEPVYESDIELNFVN